MVIKRGDIFYADLRPVVGSEQGGYGKGFGYSVRTVENNR